MIALSHYKFFMTTSFAAVGGRTAGSGPTLATFAAHSMHKAAAEPPARSGHRCLLSHTNTDERIYRVRGRLESPLCLTIC